MKLVDLFDCFLIDLDGVVYIGDSEVPGSSEAVCDLLKCGKTVIFLTNNPRHAISQYCDKLNKIGIEHDSLNIITSGTALANHIKSNFSNLHEKTAYVIGSTALKEEIGLTVVFKYINGSFDQINPDAQNDAQFLNKPVIP